MLGLRLGKLTYNWDASWGSWDKFIESTEVQEGMNKANETMSRAHGMWKGKGSAKGSAGW